MLETASATFDVGGVRLERPFKVRRLGHIGFDCFKMDECLRFYRDTLGMRVSDTIDFTERIEDKSSLAGLGETGGFFMRHGTDHHSFVLFNRGVRRLVDINRTFPPGVMINQISWQVGSLEEVVNGYRWLSEGGRPIQRTGRDMPGSNWHTYFYDPDGHTNELYYGMEQIGWDGASKPLPMHDRGFRAVPPLPQIPEEREVLDALAAGTDLSSGSTVRNELPLRYEVEGVQLPRPFKVIKIGPVSLFVADIDEATRFYTGTLGLRVTEEVRYDGARCVFLRANTEHHTIALYPLELRQRLGLRAESTTLAAGFQLGSYRQLRAARDYFTEQGARIVALPPELHPGIDYALHVLDPEGQCIQLYFTMEQIGWDGLPRPAALRPRVQPENWPDVLATQTDAYTGETLLGPLG